MNRLLPALLLCFIALMPAQAKRSGPDKVEPMVHEGVRYEAPNESGRIGLIVAHDAATGKKLWEKQIFTVQIKPDLEEDVQWDFIKSLSVEQQRLIILTTKGHRYSLNFQTREVLKLE